MRYSYACSKITELLIYNNVIIFRMGFLGYWFDLRRVFFVRPKLLKSSIISKLKWCNDWHFYVVIVKICNKIDLVGF